MRAGCHWKDRVRGDRYVSLVRMRVPPRYERVHRLGTSPWIMELLWSLPVTPKRADTMLSLIGETVQKRLRLRPEFDDLVSYLVSLRASNQEGIEPELTCYIASRFCGR